MLMGFVVYFAVVSGCAAGRPTPPAPPAAPVSNRQEATVRQPTMRAPSAQWILNHYTDLPIPNGYEFKPDESFVFVQDALRSADLKYEGNLPVEKLIRFYAEAMPTNGWQFLRMTGVKMKTITFVKAGEICEILIMTLAPRPAGAQDEWEALPPPRTHLHIKLNAY